MPTYSQTLANIENSRTTLKNIEGAINRKKDLGRGYTAIIRLSNRGSTVDVKIEGPQRAINRIPPGVIISYAQLLNKIRRWLDDLEPDFPTL